MSPSYPSLYKRTFATEEDFENCYPVNYSVNNIGSFLGQYLFPMVVLAIGFNGSFMLSAIIASLHLPLWLFLINLWSVLAPKLTGSQSALKTGQLYRYLSVYDRPGILHVLEHGYR